MRVPLGYSDLGLVPNPKFSAPRPKALTFVLGFRVQGSADAGDPVLSYIPFIPKLPELLPAYIPRSTLPLRVTSPWNPQNGDLPVEVPDPALKVSSLLW